MSSTNAIPDLSCTGTSGLAQRSSPPQIPIPLSLLAASATDLSLDIPFSGDIQVLNAESSRTSSVTSIDESARAAVFSTHGEAFSSPTTQKATPISPLSPSFENSSYFALPIPTLNPNKSQASLTFSDVIDDTVSQDPLSPEIAAADIAVAPDGSFVETSSGPAARELKRRYDQHYRVGISVRSPYAITAFVNQHGKQMYRVGHRDLSAPMTSSVVVDALANTMKAPDNPTSPRTKRRSRMSMHSFLPPTMFQKQGFSVSSRPQTIVTQGTGSRKLRKTHSIPDMTNLGLGNTANAGPSHHPGAISPVTGRAHSHSVTAADIARPPTIGYQYPAMQISDIFGDMMDWSSAASSASTSFSAHSLHFPGNAASGLSNGKGRANIAQPFGPCVLFESPLLKPTIEFVPAHRFLREMQSFESGMTAKQCHSQLPSGQSPAPSESNDYLSVDSNGSRPPSALRVRKSVISSDPDAASSNHPASSTLAPKTAMVSHYSTDVFDILQTYRGLPRLDKFSPESEGTTVIKMSLSADETAAPRDDPRFVIWGEIQRDWDRDDNLMSKDGFTDVSSLPSSSISRRRSSKVTKGKLMELPIVRVPTTQKVLIAATIERWIAQLTSDLNYDELLDFFLTYRTYVSAVDLCHLLICRFHWTLQQAKSPQDETVRRIVRVRTFVAIRYWLLTFFTVDFLPDREQRLLLAKWLNTLVVDPILEKHHDGLGIVRRLIKVANDCKQAHSPAPVVPKSQTSHRTTAVNADHVLGKQFAEATARKLSAEEQDLELDLDFVPQDKKDVEVSDRFSRDPVNAHLSAAHIGAGVTPVSPASIPLSSFGLSKRVDSSLPTADHESPFIQTPATLPVHHSALSRAFVKTIGRLGRWKRVLNSRAYNRTSMADCTGVSAFDLELNVSRDLLTVNGGVEQYLKMIETTSALPNCSASNIPHVPPIPNSSESVVVTDPSLPASKSQNHETASPPSESSTLSVIASARDVTEPNDLSCVTLKGREETNLECLSTEKGLSNASDCAASLRSSSTDSLGAPIPGDGVAHTFNPVFKQPWEVDVVSIDDLDLSDTSSDAHVPSSSAPSGLRKADRKLPLRRDFEFVKRPESVSSMGIISRESIGSGPSSSITSSSSFTGLGGSIQQWQVNAIIDSLSNDGESGDVEDALRRLEGQINPEKLQEKASKVDGWVRTIQERMALGDYGDEEPRNLSDDDNDNEDIGGAINSNADYLESIGATTTTGSVGLSRHERPVLPSLMTPSLEHSDSELAHTPIPSQTLHQIPNSYDLNPSSPRADEVPTVHEAIPIEILRSRLTSTELLPRYRRSFVHGHRAEVLAEHFSMIDRELFMGVKFEELVLDDWMRCHEINIYDWSQYIRDRVRWKAGGLFREKTSALAAVRARFNVMTSFVISEVVLSPPNERALVIGKFIRIAWKAYEFCNFNLLTAIIAALQGEWVSRAMRSSAWNRIGTFESRAFKDLKQFTSNVDDFKFIRQAIDAIADAKVLDDSSHTSSVLSGKATNSASGKDKHVSDHRSPIPSSCIPFIGIYLSQLHRLTKLPDLIDPTAPNAAVGIDPITANFDPPSHPEVFSALAPLPESMHLEPLINVHKQRKIAAVIKSLVAGQHLASRMKFEVDKKLFQKCLRLRGLNSKTLQRVLAVAE